MVAVISIHAVPCTCSSIPQGNREKGLPSTTARQYEWKQSQRSSENELLRCFTCTCSRIGGLAAWGSCNTSAFLQPAFGLSTTITTRCSLGLATFTRWFRWWRRAYCEAWTASHCSTGGWGSSGGLGLQQWLQGHTQGVPLYLSLSTVAMPGLVHTREVYSIG